MTRLGLPISTSQAVVGAIIGWNLYASVITDTGVLSEIVLSWMLCPVLAGLAAVVLLHLGNIVVEKGYDVLIQAIAVCIVGGLGSILGSIFGAIFMTWVPEALQSLLGMFKDIYPTAMTYLYPMQTVVFVLLIVVFLVLEPHGLADGGRVAHVIGGQVGDHLGFGKHGAETADGCRRI